MIGSSCQVSQLVEEVWFCYVGALGRDCRVNLLAYISVAIRPASTAEQSMIMAYTA